MKELRDDEGSDNAYDTGRYEFFLYTTSVGVIIAFLAFVGLFTGLVEKNGATLAVGCNLVSSIGVAYSRIGGGRGSFCVLQS